MANTVAILSNANTFSEWLVVTNADSQEINSIGKYNWHKDTGTLYLDGSPLALQVNSAAVFASSLQVTGTGSYATIQNNLQVDGQVYFTNTVLGLTNTGRANVGGILFALSPNTGLMVANTANIGGMINVIGAASLGNTLYVAANTTLDKYLAVTNDISGNNITLTNNINGRLLNISLDGNISRTLTVGSKLLVSGDTYTNTLQANSSVNTASLTVTGSGTVNTLQANSSVNTTTLTVTGSGTVNTLQANASVNTTTLTVVGSGTVNTLQANASVNTRTLTVTGSGTVNTLQANSSVNTSLLTAFTLQSNFSVNTASLTVTGSGTVNTLQANSSVNTTTLTVTGSSTVNTLQANASVNTRTLTVTGSSTVNMLQANTSVNTGTITANSGLFGSLQTSGALIVQGNFQINGSTVYNSNIFTLNSGGTLLAASTSELTVYRPTASSNASVRWNETNGYWDILDVSGVNQGAYYRLLSTNSVSGLTRAIGISDGGTNQTSFTSGQITYFNGTSLTSLAVQTPSTTGLSTSNTITGITVDSYGRITSLPNTKIAITSAQVSGLATSATTDTSNANNITAGTLSTSRLPGSGVIAGVYGGTTQIPVVTVDSVGRVTSAANVSVSTTISLSAESGTGSVAGGGTLTLSGGNGVSTSVTGSTYTINNTGVNTISGTTNQVSANASTGNIVLSLPQSINTTASPTFSGVTATTFTGNLVAISASSRTFTGNLVATTASATTFTGALVGNATTATSAVTAANTGTFMGLSLQSAATVIGVNQVARSDSFGYMNVSYISSSTVNNEIPTLYSANQVIVTTGSDNLYRKISYGNFVSSLVIPVSQISGTLPVLSGGTGVTSSTGSGNNVLSTSPTLVTPILGTPQSGVLTNATGLPLTTGVTGTLPVSNGGTGVTVSTGTGSVVLNTNPVIVLTNATGLPLTTGVTGTLPVGNGGTGVTTSTGSGNNVLSIGATLVAPALGTPASGNVTNCTGSTAANTTSDNTLATTAFVQSVMQVMYPIGSIYTNGTDSTNPATLFGFGTWAAFGAGRVAVGYDVTNALFNTVGLTGGNASWAVVSHTHSASTSASATAITTLSNTTHTHTGTTSTDPGHTHSLTLGDNNNDNTTPAAASNGVVVAPVGSTQSAGSHAHTFTTASNSLTPTAATTVSVTPSTSITSTGSSGTNQNYQPYITVYMWKRTA